MFTATPNFQISLRFTLWTPISSCRVFGDKCTKWPQNDLKHYKIKGTSIKLEFIKMAHKRPIKMILKIAIFGHETWPLAKVPEVAHILSYTRGSKLSLFSLYGQRFPRCGQFSKLWYLGIGQSFFFYFNSHAYKNKFIFVVSYLF